MLSRTIDDARIIEIKRDMLSENSAEADNFRLMRKAGGTLYFDIMASPGGGKTTLILAIIDELRRQAAGKDEAKPTVAVIEADLESDVDALKIKEAGVASVEINTKGICHVEMGMVEKAWAAFNGEDFDYLFLENIGNLVCPADFDTGAHVRVMLLSVPEGYDKVYKYPPMFAIVDALIVTKCDYLPLNPDFNMEALKQQAKVLNPNLKIFETSARTGSGLAELTNWITGNRVEYLLSEKRH